SDAVQDSSGVRPMRTIGRNGSIIHPIPLGGHVMRRRRNPSVWHVWCASVAFASVVAYGQANPGAQQTALMLSPESAVTVTGGQIRGVVSDKHPDIIAFKGVPFAALPVGELRW